MSRERHKVAACLMEATVDNVVAHLGGVVVAPKKIGRRVEYDGKSR